MDGLSASPTSVKKSPPYGVFMFSIACFTATAAGCAFLLASATAQGSPSAFTQNPASFVGLIFTGMWASRAWSEITRVEPETDFKFRERHRAFGLKVGTAIAAILVGTTVMGTFSGIRAGHKARLEVLTKQIAELGATGASAKQRFVDAASRETPDLPEYIQRCNDLEAAINDYAPAIQHMDALLGQTQQELQDLKSDPSLATLLTTIVVMRSILRKDAESVEAFRKEIGFARQLAPIPPGGRSAFYDANIQPVVDEEGKIAKEEIEILKDAKARGVKLPQNLYSEYGIN